VSNTLADLMEENLLEALGERDSERRRFAIGRLYTEEWTFFDPEEQIIVGHDALNAKVDRILQGSSRVRISFGRARGGESRSRSFALALRT